MFLKRSKFSNNKHLIIPEKNFFMQIPALPKRLGFNFKASKRQIKDEQHLCVKITNLINCFHQANVLKILDIND